MDQMPLTQGNKAYKEIKSMILDGRLKPSASYLETELADQIRVSRTPVREAALRLEREGLVIVRPRRGMQVVPVSTDDMAEIYQLLTVLEPLAAELAAKRELSEAEIELMERATQEMEDALAEGDLVSWAEADDAFHALLVEASGNRRLVEATERYRAQVHRARMTTLTMRPCPSSSTEDHRSLLNCLRSGDAEGAREIHRAHRSAAGKLLVALLEKHSLDNL